MRLLTTALAAALPSLLLAMPASAVASPMAPPHASQATSEAAALTGGLIIGLDAPHSTRGALAAIDKLALTVGIGDVKVRMRGAGEAVVTFDGFRSAREAQALAEKALMQPGVAWAEPDFLLRATQDPSLPNDRLFGQQWALWDPPDRSDRGIQAPLAWSSTRGDPETVVAVLDTGWTVHPDLEGQVINGYDFVSMIEISNDGDRRDGDARDPGDWVTRDEANGELSGCEPMNSSWHGTHVTGTVVARQDNRIGVSGVAPESRVLAVRVLGKCAGLTSDIADAIVWASGGRVSGVPLNQNPADVISLSLGGAASCERTMSRAIDSARSRGAIVVVAAGNEGDPIASSSPANCPGVVSVVASDESGSRAEWSNYGTSSVPATISAPGVDILSTYNDGERGPGSPIYDTASGTSMAAPHAAGVIALVLSSGVEPGQVLAKLRELARPFPSSRTCGRITCGAGLLSVAGLSSPGPPPGPDPEPTKPPGLVGPVSVSYTIKGPTATATVRWQYSPPAGEPVARQFRYRVRLSGQAWSAWKDTNSMNVSLDSVPRGALSLMELVAVNRRGVGPVYQVTIYPN